MSKTEWKPGDVAWVESGLRSTVGDWPRLALVRPRREAATALEFAYVSGGFDMVGDLAEGFTARPLVVIDPEDREAVDGLCKALVEAMYAAGDERSAANGVHPATVAAALREFANPTPPKPDEPTGLGAVVEDEDGVRYSRVAGDDEAPWAKSPVGDWQIECFAWHEFPAVRVLSEGVR